MPIAPPFGAFRLALAAAASAALAAAQAPGAGELRSVRAWSGPDVTRIVVELSQETKWKYGRLPNPPRLFFDFADTRPRRGTPRIQTVPVGDARVRQARVGLKDTRTTRLVLDLAGEVEYEVSRLTNPERLVVEVRLKGAARPAETLTENAPKTSAAGGLASAGVKPAEVPAESRNSESQARRPAETPAPAPAKTVAAKPARASEEPAKAAEAPTVSAKPESRARRTAETEPAVDAARAEMARSIPAEAPEKIPARRPAQPESAAVVAEAAKAAPSRPVPALPAEPARPTRRGERSLTRALGLHIGRVVLDPGHGGHDQGTEGPTGLLEKELVLDVALRLGALLEDRMGAEVVYTRRADEFIPLEERTAIANESRADLFLSIHANSSPVRRVSGAEVFYLNFTTSREALELAARENAGHNRSIFELRELIQKIALKDKLDESREFAGYMQQELSKEWRRLNPVARDRGVKTAPFVVLIGASMPSVLAEIGFLSNPKDELLMKKPDYRQKLAEALYRGIERYARSLGQTQALRAATAAEPPQSTR
ncbi:MAG: N-acetylmuramoyl-L-alanine amidase [Bryobacteraceae bacterium]